jgi:hypothetical protein
MSAPLSFARVHEQDGEIQSVALLDELPPICEEGQREVGACIGALFLWFVIVPSVILGSALLVSWAVGVFIQ